MAVLIEPQLRNTSGFNAMKTFQKALLWLTGGLLVAVGSVLVWVLLTWDRVYDDIPNPQLAASTDPDVIARGQYLVRGPAHCSNCHVGDIQEMVRADAGEQLPMKGGMEFPLGPIAVLYTANLTPDPDTGIGRYSDGEILRLLRHNVKPNHRASIAPLMPYANMADDDLVAIVSYLRSNPPVRNEVPAARWRLFGKTIAALVRPAAIRPIEGHSPPKVAPAEEPSAERGSYLANSVANCMACHSPIDPATGELTGPAFSGNARGERSTLDRAILLRAPNLTPDPSGVLVNFADEDTWIGRFRVGRVIAASYMPWGPFSRMSENDLRSIYRYLKTLRPAANDVGQIVERIEE
jgi:mono/diheme cytochrome c family protein